MSWGYCMPDCPHDPIYPACTYDPIFPDFVRDHDEVDLVNYTTSYEPDIRDVVLDVSSTDYILSISLSYALICSP